MTILDRDKARFEELDDLRRRIDDEFHLLVQQMRDGSMGDIDRARNQAQFLHVRHQGLIREMVEMLYR